MRSRDVRTQRGGLAKLLLDRESGAPNAKSLLQGRALWSARLASWAEEDFLQHCSAQYCDSIGHPRSTIAANYSLDGTVVASTHGDHSVKLVDSYTGCKLQCLVGHVRTPWVVRFSPCTPDIVASGSLDYSVSVWQASQGQRLHHHSFGKPIASIAFHPSGHLLAVASGHKVYVWPYQAGLDSQPSVLLKTRRSLRALHFHPLGRPLLLTAEVVERRSSAADGAGWSSAATSSIVRVPGPVHEAATGELDAALAGQLMQMRLAGARRPEPLPMPCLAQPSGLALVVAEPGSPSMEPQPGAVAAPPLVNGPQQAQTRVGGRQAAATYLPAPAASPVSQLSSSLVERAGRQPPEEVAAVPTLPLLVPMHGRLGQEQAQGARAASLLTAQAAARAMAEAAAAATAAAVRAAGSSQADQPCLVNLCLWPFDVQQPRQPLGQPLLVCLLYELRVYSVAPGPSFGQVVAARPLLAAHCLTSLQFSPTSEHLLLAYGRRHLSLCSLVLEAGGLTPVHTVIEVYRVADLALVRLLPSKEDEVNCAAWSPLPGGGLMYGTKEGKLRLLRHDRLLPSEPSLLPGTASSTADEELWDAERRAPGSATEEDDG
ncbi:quinon protein alcohol dehydrogenase-like superfamily [Haematococcus lacustris]